MLKELLDNNRLFKALYFKEPNFLDKTIPSDMDRTSLIYDLIWPYRFIPDIQDTPKSLITTEWKYRLESKVDELIKLSTVRFFVIVHKDIISIDYGLRTDFIINEINECRKSAKLFRSMEYRFGNCEDFIADQGGMWPGTFLTLTAYKL